MDRRQRARALALLTNGELVGELRDRIELNGIADDARPPTPGVPVDPPPDDTGEPEEPVDPPPIDSGGVVLPTDPSGLWPGYDRPAVQRHECSFLNAGVVGLRHASESVRDAIRLVDTSGNFPDVFAEVFVVECGDVRETTVTLRNSNPAGRGVARIRGLRILTSDDRAVSDPSKTYVLWPAGSHTFTDYVGTSRRTAGMGQAELMREFFASMKQAPDVTPGAEFESILERELRSKIANPLRVGPHEVEWDKEGYGHGGQGIEPFRHSWRLCGWGLALAALVAVRTSNRSFRDLSNADGAFAFDPSGSYTHLGFFLPEGYERNAGQGPIVPSWEHEWSGYKGIDDQHYPREFEDAVFVYRHTGHPWFRWRLECMANFLAAVHLATGSDREGQHSGWWSLDYKLARVDGRTPWCGRGPVHECSAARRFVELGIGGRSMELVADKYEALFVRALDANGCAFENTAGSTPSAKPSWDDDDPIAQVRELQFAQIMYERSNHSDLHAAVRPLARFLGPFPPSMINYANGEGWSGEDGKADRTYALMTHGDLTDYHNDPLELRAVAVTRGVEGGGAQPLNSCRSRELWTVPFSTSRG